MKQYVDKSISFDEYSKLIDQLVADGRTTGPNQSEKMAEYTRLNRQRMVRLGKTVDPLDEATNGAAAISRRMIWLIITEAWCGDAAQNIPVIEKVAGLSDKIETRYILREENLELMDRFLTEGARSIPKLIALDARTYEVLGTWGPRPKEAQDLFASLKADGVEKALITEQLQRWYNADRGRSLQQEFAGLVGLWQDRMTSRLSGGLPPAGHAMTTGASLD